MTLEEYKPRSIEVKWQKIWEDTQVFAAVTPSKDPQKRPKYYCLSMFPYPSGQIHMGHIRNYSIGDVISRYKAMCGFNVLQPIGWDAFGMPAENAAIERGVHPEDWTLNNIKQMKAELKNMGFAYDWDREITTCLPEYYRWEQLFFLRFFKEGLAYKKKGIVNWCESCKTVLANEQVHNGKCWRCSSDVIEKDMEQWYLRITDYAESLLEGHKELNSFWPERVIEMQKNWIGKSEGCIIDFKVKNSEHILKVFTTRADTLYGVTFLTMSPFHPLAKELCGSSLKELTNLKLVVKNREEKEFSKRGFFTGSFCIHPLSGEEIPIWIGEFVLMDYGTGAVMGVPAHDDRDFEFAMTHKLPVKKVVTSKTNSKLDIVNRAYVDFGVLINSAEFSGLESEEAIKKITTHLENIGLGKATIQYKLKDWGISRQRYWGAPIPIIYCDKCGILPVPENELPVVLPYDVTFKNIKGNPLSSHPSWAFTSCPKCGSPSKRETDTMDTFIESSWYYARYISAKFDKGPFDIEEVKEWLPVDCYIGGIEHACMHLLYARFFHKILKKWGYFSDDEPFLKLITQGMVIKDGAKMSKSLGNVVSPTEMVAKYGADTVRLFCLFAAPIEKDLEWNEKGVEGCYRFLNRIWRLVSQFQKELCFLDTKKLNATYNHRLKKIRTKTHWMIKKVTDDIEEYKFNTAISACMELVNEIYIALNDEPSIFSTESGASVLREAIESLTLTLSPFCPHIADEIWERLGNKKIILKESWPKCDSALLEDQFFLLVIQVNGKVREKFLIEKNLSEEQIKKIALSSPKVQKWIPQEGFKKIVYVKERLLNVVI